jgi:putative FmdB family regulatory protein
MPLYEYRCQDCGHSSEEMQRLSDPPIAVCPACGGRYKKLVSAPAFQFKGSGWYVTDYARKSAPGKAEAGGEAKAEGKEAAGKEPKQAGDKPVGEEKKPKARSKATGAE